MADALSDLEGLIREGIEPTVAVVEAAKSYAIKPDVLLARAAGTRPFEDYVSSIRRAEEFARRKSQVREATRAHMSAGEQWWESQDNREARLREALTVSLQSAPTVAEFEWAKQYRLEYISERQARFHADVVRALTTSRKEFPDH